MERGEAGIGKARDEIWKMKKGECRVTDIPLLGFYLLLQII